MSDSFTGYLKSKGYTSRTVETFTATIRRYFEWLEKENLEADQVTYTDLLLLIKSYQKQGVSQKTINHYINSVKHLYDHLIREEKIEINPATDIEIKGIKRKVLYHILEPEELNHLYNHLNTNNPHSSKNKVILGLLIYHG